MILDDTEIDLNLTTPQPARVYDYLLGGAVNHAADRELADRVRQAFPLVTAAAWANRRFLGRAVSHLAQRGIDQFLDIGAGIPVQPYLHEVARQVLPDARVLYVDSDPTVLAFAAVLLADTPRGRTACVQADVTDPAALLSHPTVHAILDFSRPVAVCLGAVLHHVPDEHNPRRIVATFRGALAPGSALILTHATADLDPNAAAAAEVYRQAGITLHLRDRAQVTALFDGWSLLDPGVSSTCLWRPDTPAHPDDAHAACFAGVATKTA